MNPSPRRSLWRNVVIRPNRQFMFLAMVFAGVYFGLMPHAAVARQTLEPLPVDWSSIGESSNDMDVNWIDQEAEIVTRGQDPFFYFRLPPLPPSQRDWMLAWEYFSPQGLSGLQWRSGPGVRRPPFTELPPMPKAEGWTTYAVNLSKLNRQISPSDATGDRGTEVRIDLGVREGRRLRVRNVVVRPMSDRELSAAQNALAIEQTKRQQAKQFRDYHERTWDVSLESVVWDGMTLKLSGNCDPNDASDSFLIIARPPHDLVALDPQPSDCVGQWQPVINQRRGTWTLAIDSTPKSPWRAAGTTFQAVRLTRAADESYTPISPVRYAEVNTSETSTSKLSAPPNLQAANLQAAKGLTCITSRFSADQLRQLGLRHASVNILLTGLVSPTERDGWSTIRRSGRTWWVNERRLQSVDRNVQVINQAGAVAAGILLIPTRADDANQTDGLPHPASSAAGTYAMPNLTTTTSVELYATTLDVLAQRYSGQSNRGRIDHWIVHNEVDYGWQWTNMGLQPMELFMDHYVRSMRLVDSAVRSQNPFARVFISLTHRWNTKDNLHWKTYAPRFMLDWLIRECQLHGDFPWGVAYHPYPQSLWQAATWNDTKVADDFDTELITVKNLQVLDRFVKLDSSRTQAGDVRPVICSEQGFHAAEDDPGQLRIQAAALLYTWKKLRQCSSILAFDYHRPSDHPREGGLRLGLRGLPSKQHPLGREKPAWDVFTAIGTDDEAKLLEQYREVWETEATKAKE